MENITATKHDATLTRRAFAIGAGAWMAAMLAGCGTGGSASSTSSSSAGSTTTAYDTSLDDGIKRISSFAFDTVIDLSLYGDQSVLDEAVAACDRYDQLFSAQTEGSDVWRINHAAGQPVQVDPETAKLIKDSLVFCEASNGVFDITIGAVSLLWDFDAYIKPDDAAIQAALPHIDWRNVQVEGSTVTLADPLAAIDLGGIAKGWIADALATLFRSRGVSSGLINLGGNVLAVGQKPSGKPWTIGLRDPNTSAGKAVATIEVCDKSVVTSGLYERHFVQDGVDYYHILDPKTGYPAITDVRADTIVSDLSLEGDGLSTTLFIFGSSRGIDEIEKRADVEALFTLDNGSTRQSSGFGDLDYQVLES